MRKLAGSIVGVACFSIAIAHGLATVPSEPPENAKHGHKKPSHHLPQQHGGADVVLKREGNGHFFADVEVNGTRIGMLADTGASVVALSIDDAEAAGINTDRLDFTEKVSTANGAADVAEVTLDEIEVGTIRRSNVRAVVARGLSTSLLGMSFFNTLAKVGIERDEMRLED